MEMMKLRFIGMLDKEIKTFKKKKLELKAFPYNLLKFFLEST